MRTSVPVLAGATWLCAGPCTGERRVDTVPIDTADTSCEVTVDATVPVANAGNAYIRGDIEFHLSDPDATATIETDIPGHLEVDDDLVYWRLDAPLQPETAYVVTLHYCGGDATLAFTTSTLGEPLALPLDGQVYELELEFGRVVRPDGWGGVMMTYVADPFVSLADGGDGSLAVVEAFATTDGDAQDTCRKTNASVADFSETPYFVADPATIQLSVAGDTFTVYGARLEGTVAPDGDTLGGVVLTGQMRMQPWANLLGMSVDDACTYIADECVPCDHDPEDTCTDVLVDEIRGLSLDDLALIDVADNDCPGCETGAPVCPE